MVVTKATLIGAIYKIFYNTIVDNYTNPHPTKYLAYSSFPLDKLSDRTAYPLIVIDGPDFSESEFTMRETGYECEVTLMFYELSKKDLNDMSQEIVKIIEDRTDTVFVPAGIEDLHVTGTSTEPFDHGSDKGNHAVLGHVKTITFEMVVYLNRITI